MDDARKLLDSEKTSIDKKSDVNDYGDRALTSAVSEFNAKATRYKRGKAGRKANGSLRSKSEGGKKLINSLKAFMASVNDDEDEDAKRRQDAVAAVVNDVTCDDEAVAICCGAHSYAYGQRMKLMEAAPQMGVENMDFISCQLYSLLLSVC